MMKHTPDNAERRPGCVQGCFHLNRSARGLKFDPGSSGKRKPFTNEPSDRSAQGSPRARDQILGTVQHPPFLLCHPSRWVGTRFGGFEIADLAAPSEKSKAGVPLPQRKQHRMPLLQIEHGIQKKKKSHLWRKSACESLATQDKAVAPRLLEGLRSSPLRQAERAARALPASEFSGCGLECGRC